MSEAQNSGKQRVRGRPFQPGQSGNPGGRPKKKILTSAIERFLEAHPTEADAIAKAMVEQAKAGNVQAFREMTDRTEGKVPVRIAGEHEGEAIDVSVTHQGAGAEFFAEAAKKLGLAK